MKKTAKLGLLLTALTLSTASLAFSSSMPFSAHINPGATYQIPTTSLYKDAEYMAECKVTDVVTGAKGSNGIRVYTSNGSGINVDGMNLHADNVILAKTKPTGSTLSIYSLKRDTQASITNLDFTDALYIDCVANLKVG